MGEKNRTYTATDLESYHAGTMPANEMHALERAALEDPFLADALEGYVNTTNFERDIVELKALLKEKGKKRNVFTITSFAQNKWWQIAALFIIIAGAGYFFYRINNAPKENSLAKNEIKSSAGKQENAATTINDSTDTNDDIAFEERKASQFSHKDKAIFPKPNTRSEKDSYASDSKAQYEAVAPSVSKSKDAVADNISIDAEDKNHNKEHEKEYFLKGKVTDEKGNPIALASISDPARKEIILTDTTGNFLLKSQDSNTTLIASAAGYASKNFTLKKDEQRTIEMNKNDANLNEAVTATDIRRQKKGELYKSKALSGKFRILRINTSEIQPFPVNEKFIQYLKENIVPVYDGDNERQSG